MDTALDKAHAAMDAKPDDDRLRLRFYERLADSELFLLLEQEPAGTDIEPRHVDTTDGRFVLAFDREDRLTEFAGGPAPYAALSGRTITEMLAGRRIGLALNPEVAASATLIPWSALDWLRSILAQSPEAASARPLSFHRPDLPDDLIAALDAKLATATGLAGCAYLAAVTYDDNSRTHLLAFVDPCPGAETPLAQAAREALVFSGLDSATWDVAFLSLDDPALPAMARSGLRFDLPQPAEPVKPDPDAPPRLR